MGKKKKASPEKFYDELIAVLWTDLLFFIPSKDIPTEFLKKYPKLKEIFDTILVMDKRIGLMKYKPTRSNEPILQKAAQLDKNVFKLIKRKSNKNHAEFNYILDKYFEQIEFMFYISEWTNNNLTNSNLENVDDTIKGLFLIQQKYFKKHFESITKHFYPTNQESRNANFDVIQTIETHFRELLLKYDQTQLISTINPITISLIEKKQSANNTNKVIDITEPKRLEKKQPLITEMEAETFLLKSVFGVKLN